VLPQTVLSTLMRRAYRRPIAKGEVDEPMAFYRQRGAEGDFEAGITQRLTAVAHQPGVPVPRGKRTKENSGGRRYRIGDLELASRLSFFPVEQHTGR